MLTSNRTCHQPTNVQYCSVWCPGTRGQFASWISPTHPAWLPCWVGYGVCRGYPGDSLPHGCHPLILIVLLAWLFGLYGEISDSSVLLIYLLQIHPFPLQHTQYSNQGGQSPTQNPLPGGRVSDLVIVRHTYTVCAMSWKCHPQDNMLHLHTSLHPPSYNHW